MKRENKAVAASERAMERGDRKGHFSSPKLLLLPPPKTYDLGERPGERLGIGRKDRAMHRAAESGRPSDRPRERQESR